MGGAMLSKSLLPLSLKGGAVFPPCYLTWGQVKKPGGGFEDNGDLLHKALCTHWHIQCPNAAADHHRPMPPPETPGHSQASLGQSLVGPLLPSPGSWCIQGSVFALQESVSPVVSPLFLPQCGRPGFDPWVGMTPLEKEMATHSSTLAWKIPWTEEPGRLQSMWSQRVGPDWATFTFTQVLGCHSRHGGKDCSCKCRGWEFDPWVGKILFTYTHPKFSFIHTHTPQAPVYTHTQPSSLICVS